MKADWKYVADAEVLVFVVDARLSGAGCEPRSSGWRTIRHNPRICWATTMRGVL